MFLKISTLILVALFLLAPAVVSNAQQPGTDDGWTSLSAGQSLYDIHYREDRTVWMGDRKITTCSEGTVGLDLSKPSPQKSIVLLMCVESWDTNKAYLVGVGSHRLVYPLRITDLVFARWVSWSPNESYALLASGGEGFEGPLILVNLNTGTAKQFEYRHLGSKGETEVMDEQATSWLNGNSVRMKFNVVCQVFSDEPRCAYGRCKGDCDNKIHRSYWVRVNLSPFSISYTNLQPTKAVGNRSARVIPPIEQLPITETYTPRPLPPEPTGERVTLQSSRGSVSVRNFFKNAVLKYPEYVAVTSTPSFGIIYVRLTKDTSFRIGLSALPLETSRAAAEKAFLEILDITKESACVLDVTVAIPDWLKPGAGGTATPLSFCTNAPKSPNLTIPTRSANQVKSARTKQRVSTGRAQADKLIRNGNPSNVGNIRQTDFLNFTYPTSLCRKELGLGTEVTVHDGDFKHGSDADETYFGVMNKTIIYADLTGSRQEEAIVHTVCGHTGYNWWLEEFFVYADRNSSAALVAELNQDQMISDYHRYYPNGDLLRTTNDGTRVRGGSLLVDWAADGPHCCPKYIVTLEYRWNGRQLILNGRPQRKLFKQ